MDKIVLNVREEEDIAKSRRAAVGLARRIGMDNYQAAEIELSTSELATNLIHHAHGGVISIEHVEEDGRQGIKVISEDSGPGISDINLAMTEGYSTGGTLGSGLPGVKRMMDEFEITSELGRGTRVATTKWL